MPYVTPDNTPVNSICWRISIPNDEKFLAAFLGQITELIYTHNWEDTGGISEIEATNLAISMYDSLYNLGNCMIGQLIHYITASPPDNVLACDGSIYQQADYPELVAVLHSSLIIDPLQFQVPDLRDRFLLGSGTTYSPNDSGGEVEHTLTEQEMPAHNHTYNFPSATVDFKSTGVPDLTALTNPPIITSTSTRGNDQPHNNMPPFMAWPIGVIYR